MILQEILESKGTEVHTISPDATLDDAIEQLVRYRIGSLVVCECATENTEPPVVGIITERDILCARAARHAPFESVQVADAMPSGLVAASPEDRIEYAMATMTQRRVRHLPVLSHQRLVGIVSIGDIVKAQLDAQMIEIHYMRSYIQGEGAELTTPPEESPRPTTGGFRTRPK